MSSNITSPEVTVEIAKELGLMAEEYQKIVEIMGRKPNFTELSIFSVMWSEHCSYKNSIKYLKKLPRKGKHLLVEKPLALDRVELNSVIAARRLGMPWLEEYL